jgi:hypothetical protein
MDLSDFFWADFTQAQQLIDRGEEIAREEQNMTALLALADEIGAKRALVVRDWRRKGSYTQLPDPVFTQVRLVSIGIDGAQESEEEAAEHVSPKFLDTVFDDFFYKTPNNDKLDAAIETVRVRGRYENVGYHLEQNTGGEYTLVLTGVKSPDKKNELTLTLAAAMHLGNGYEWSTSEWLALTFRDIFMDASLLQINSSFSRTEVPALSLAYTKELSSVFAVRAAAIGTYAESSLRRVQPEEEHSTFGFVDTSAQFIYTLADFFDLSASYRYQQLWYQNKSNSTASYSGDLHLASFGMRYETFNTKQPLLFKGLSDIELNFRIDFPFAGSRMAQAFPYYERFTLNYQKAWTPRAVRSFISDLSVASYRGELESAWTLYNAAGKTGIPGYSGTQLLGRDKLTVGYTYLELIPALSSLLNMRSFFVLTARAGNVWNDFADIDSFTELRGGIRAGIQIETPIGTLILGPEYSLDGKFQFCIYYN